MVTIATGVQNRPAAAPQEGVWVPDYKLFQKPTFVQAIAAICSHVSAYGGTPGYFAIIAEMRKPEDYTKALAICQGAITVVYVTVGVVMYYYCGSYVSSPALGSAGVVIKKASYGVAIPGLIVTITLVTHVSRITPQLYTKLTMSSCPASTCSSDSFETPSISHPTHGSIGQPG